MTILSVCLQFSNHVGIAESWIPSNADLRALKRAQPEKTIKRVCHGYLWR